MRATGSIFRGGVAVATLCAIVACGSGKVSLPNDAAGTELYDGGETALAEGKWRRAVESFDTLLRNYPTSPHLPEARLGLGRAYYEQGRADTLLMSIDSFKNFLTYHPSHSQVDYAQLMVAMGYLGLMRAPDRDQAYTREALEEFEIFMEDYPDSSHRELAFDNMRLAINTLAAHELNVAKFQIGRGRYPAARLRCEYALRKYPTTGYRCEILYTLAESLRKEGDPVKAQEYYQQLVAEHPSCDFVDEAQKRLRQGGATGSSE